jgi:hypothetical protein
VAKKKVGNQIDNLTPQHKKLEIDLTPVRKGGVRHAFEKLSMKATTLLQTSSQSKV